MLFSKVAIIGGTGMGRLFEEGGNATRCVLQTTPYGGPVHYYVVQLEDVEFIFVDRHHATGTMRMPHQLDHRAYMHALTQTLGVRCIFATSAVGGINFGDPTLPNLEVGSIVAPKDFVDYTSGSWTFSTPEWTHDMAFHVPSSDFFCPRLRRMLLKDPRIVGGGILGVAIRGPRYETPAEVRKFAREGISLLGMPTVAPEAVLAREAAVHFQPVCIVTDPPQDQKSVYATEVQQVMARRQQILYEVFTTMIAEIGCFMEHNTCQCTKNPSVFSVVPTA